MCASILLTLALFLGPLDLHAQWLWLLPPLVLGIAIVYKALKIDDLSKLAGEAMRLTVYLHLLAAFVAVLLWAMVEGVERL